jgi:transglutaminase-like putative cysteine protease
MRFRVRHKTVYRYQEPVFLAPHTFRLRPRVDGAQFLVDYRLGVSPAPAGRTEYLDQDGNVVTDAWFVNRVAQLEVESAFEVDTQRENPFDFLLRADAMRLPFHYTPELHAALTTYRTGETEPAVRELAEAVASRTGWSTVSFLTELSRELHSRTRQIIRPDGLPLAPSITLSSAEGSCRDLAVLYVAACRALGIAARFVSGYEKEAASHERSDMHAWAEVYLPGGGWRGFDPARGIAVTYGHIAVAAAAQAELAAPVTGAYGGTVGSEMDVSLVMEVL